MRKLILGVGILSTGISMASTPCTYKYSNGVVIDSTCHEEPWKPANCYYKIGPWDPEYCNRFDTASDSAFFMFDIILSLAAPPESIGTPANAAWINQVSEEMFTKYDIRYVDTTTKVEWPLRDNGPFPMGPGPYYYEMVMTKVTALGLSNEPYIYSLNYRDRPIMVSVFRPIPKIGPRVKQEGFDILGKVRNGSARGTPILYRVPHPR